MAKKLLLSVFFLIAGTSFAFSQSEQLKDVFNNMAFYNQKHDLKYLGEAKKAIDKTIITKSDSSNLAKSVYKAVVYSTIAYADTANVLKMPDNFLEKTTAYANSLFDRKKVYNFSDQITYIKRNIANVYIRRGFNDMQRNNYRSAIMNFEKAKSLVPSAEHLAVYLAYASNKLGELNKSADYYDNLLKNTKASAEVILTAERIYKLLGDTAKALNAVKNGRAVYPGDRKLLFEEANIYNNKKDYGALSSLIGELTKTDPDDYDVNFLAAVCYDQLNKTNQAELFYKKAMTLDHTNYDPVFNIAILYMKKGLEKPGSSEEDFNMAQYYLEKANEMDPNNPDFLKTLKLLYDKTGNIAASERISTQINQIIN